MSDTRNPNTGEMVTKGKSPPHETVIQAVADAEGTDPLDTSLSEAIDLELLKRCLHEYDFDIVSFDYNGYRVDVESNGRVVLTE